MNTTIVRLFSIQFFSLFFLLLSTNSLSAQTQVTWKQLADVRYEAKYLEDFGAEYLTPIFGKSPKLYDGKIVTVTGYMIPVDEEESAYIISRNPYSSCYFCGNAGPETIVELWIPASKRKRYKMDQRMTFKGKLKLNDTDVNHFIYILVDAQEHY
ncbi:MAG: DUF3299 domain-containing protein [Bacteroidota bacterium]